MKTRTSKEAQTFTFKAPDAASVLLAGDFTGWNRNPIPMQKQANGNWTTTVSLAPGTYHYRFVVDGEWRDDPECTLRVANPFGTEDSVRLVATSKADLARK